MLHSHIIHFVVDLCHLTENYRTSLDHHIATHPEPTENKQKEAYSLHRHIKKTSPVQAHTQTKRPIHTHVTQPTCHTRTQTLEGIHVQWICSKNHVQRMITNLHKKYSFRSCGDKLIWDKYISCLLEENHEFKGKWMKKPKMKKRKKNTKWPVPGHVTTLPKKQ